MGYPAQARPLGVKCWSAGQDGLRMVSIQRWHSLGGHPRTNVLRRHGLRGSSLLTRYCSYGKTCRNYGRSPVYGSAGRPVIPAQTSSRSRFTSTPVSRYAGRSSCDQYQHVFEAIVCSNGWDEVTAALQLVAHLERDAVNVALLVPESQRVFWWGHSRSIMAPLADWPSTDVSL